LDSANEASDDLVNAAEAASALPIVAVNGSGYVDDDYTAILDNTPAVTCDGSQTYGLTNPPAINSMPAVDDFYVICVRLTDAAGNVTYGASDAIERDADAPVFTSLVGANEAL